MKDLAYYNGRIAPLDEMMIPFNDRVCFFGDGVYDATSAMNGKILFLEEHIDRFFNSAGLLKIKIPYTKEELKNILNECVAKVDADPVFVYWQQTRATAPRNHAFPDTPSNLWIMVKPNKFKPFEERIKLTEMEDTRFLHCNIKTLNLIPSVMAAQKAEEEGCDETVFHRGDIVTECAHSNISIIKDGKFITHPLDHYVLPGIARAHLIKACKALEVPVDETTFTMEELWDADEVIVSSSSNFCMIAGSLLGKPIGGKDPETLHKIQEWVVRESREYCGMEFKGL